MNDEDEKALDAVISQAFEKAIEATQQFTFPLGSLQSLNLLFPSNLSRTLSLISAIAYPTRATTPRPYFKVTLGVGKVFVDRHKLYSFFNSVLVFESQKTFIAFAKNGYTVVVTGGQSESIIAAATFIVASDGLFVDAIAVSQGRQKNACILPPQMVRDQFDDKTHYDRLSRSTGGNFQSLGLGSFLIALLSRVATLLCAKPTAAVYLKVNIAAEAYYTARGFEPVSSIGTLLLQKVPAVHRAVNNETLLMVRRLGVPVSNTKAGAEEAAAAQVIAGLSSSPLLKQAPGNAEAGDSKSKAVDENDSADDDTTPNKKDQPSTALGNKTPRVLRSDQAAKRPDSESDDDVSGADLAKVNENDSEDDDSQSDKKPAAKNPDSESGDDVSDANAKAVDENQSDDDDSSISSKEDPRSKKAKAKDRKRDRQAFQKTEAVEVAISEAETEAGDDDTYQPTPDPGHNWQLPGRDFWDPSTGAYAAFKAKAPVASHMLSQKEVSAKHGGPSPKALSRRKIILMARTFQDDTSFMQGDDLADHAQLAARAKYHITFTDQQLVDFAAAADLKRSLQVNHAEYNKRTNLIQVAVSSYLLPANMTLIRLLNDSIARKAIKRRIRKFDVSVAWLLETSRPEVALWIDESLHGAKVHRIAGLNTVTDALSLSFSATAERDMNFVSIPQGHVATKFNPTPPPSVPWSRPQKVSRKNATKPAGAKALGSGVYYDCNGNATHALLERMKDEATALNIFFLPPPPKSDTQLVKLKWVAARGRGRKPMQDGLWHGVFAVRLGVDKSTTVLQECGLLTEWVEDAFAGSFRDECKQVASGKQAKRNPKKTLFIPAGDVHDTCSDPPPHDELLTSFTTTYLQGDQDTCLRDSLASALAAMGFEAEAMILADESSLVGCTVDLLQRTVALVRKMFREANLVMKKLHTHACAVSDIETCDASWPIILIIQSSDGCYGSHAATTWNRMLFDSNSPNPLRWSQASLDWCSGKDSNCVGFSRAYRLCPANEGTALKSEMSVGSQLRFPREQTDVLAWIVRLPSKKRLGYVVRDTNGVTEVMGEEKVARFMDPKSLVGER